MPADASPLARATTDLIRSLQEFQRAFDAAEAGDATAPATGPLFQTLRAWRTEEARTQQVPPYVVATDAVLRAIEAARPADVVQLRAIRGIGPAKAEHYGAKLLAVVAAAPAPA